MYTGTTQSQNTALNSWGKLGQKKYSFESLPKKGFRRIKITKIAKGRIAKIRKSALCPAKQQCPWKYNSLD